MRAAIGAGRRCLDGIGNGDDAGRFAIDRDEDRRGALLPQALGFGCERGRVDTGLFHDPGVADDQLPALDGAGDAFADGGSRSSSGLDEGKVALLGGIDDRGGKRMLTGALEACGKAQQLIFGERAAWS